MRITAWDREALAWVAGIYEGEGTVYAYGNSNCWHKRVTLHIVQNEREILDRLVRVLKLGRVSGPHRNSHGKFHYTFGAYTFEQVQQALVLFWPWLSERRKRQARIALLSSATELRLRRKSGPKKREARA